MEARGPRLSDGEKLIVLMLCDLYKHLKVEGEFDPDIITDAIVGGHYWGIRWEYGGLLDARADSRQVLDEVNDILDMWLFIERAYGELPQEDKSRIETEVGLLGEHPSFQGFDGNNEIEHLGVAYFLIKKLGRFKSFKERGDDLNSHVPVVDRYRRMLEFFLPMRPQLANRELTTTEIITLLNAGLA